MTTWRYALVIAIAALGLTGCLRYNANLELAEDNTVSGTFVVAVKDGAGEGYGMSDREFAEAIWEESPRAATVGETRVSDYNAEGYTGVAVAFGDVPLSTFAPTADTWGVTRVGDDFVVSGPSDAAMNPATETDSAEGGAFTGDIDQLEDAQVLLSVTFPGPVSSTNGELSGRTVTWDLQHGPAELSARGAAIAPSDPAEAVAYVVFGLLLVGGIGYALAGRKRTRHP